MAAQANTCPVTNIELMLTITKRIDKPFAKFSHVTFVSGPCSQVRSLINIFLYIFFFIFIIYV